MKKINLNHISREAETYFKNDNFSCSESVLKALINNFDMGVDERFVRVATGFSDGMGEAGCTCGTISGAIIAVGLLFGRCYSDDPSINKAKKLSKKIHDIFKHRHKATCCRSLTRGLEMGTKERFNECYSFVGEVAYVVSKMIADELDIEYI